MCIYVYTYDAQHCVCAYTYLDTYAIDLFVDKI